MYIIKGYMDYMLHKFQVSLFAVIVRNRDRCRCKQKPEMATLVRSAGLIYAYSCLKHLNRISLYKTSILIIVSDISKAIFNTVHSAKQSTMEHSMTRFKVSSN